MPNLKKESAVIFLPETGIVPFLKTLSVFGKALKNDGYDVYLIKCDGVSYRCPMMPCSQKPFVVEPAEKQQCCNLCNKEHSAAVDFYGLKTLNLKDFIDVNLTAEINSLLNIDKKDWETIKYKNFNVGQIAIYDTMLESKVLSTQNLNKEQQILYGNYLKNTALMLEVTNRIIDKIKPSIVLAYNLYAQNNAVKFACDSHGVTFKFMSNQHHLGANFALFMCSGTGLSIIESLQHIQNWCGYRNIPISAKAVRNNFDDAIYRMYSTGSHIFSSSKTSDISEIIKELDLDLNKKTVGVYTSSCDERLGIDMVLDAWNKKLDIEEVFENQIEWLKFIRDYADSQDEAQFVIRIHPRESRGVQSKHLGLLKEEFSNSAKNFKVIWPDNKISSYDLFEIIDVCLTSHSTIGSEAQRLGIPMLSYVKNLTYPNDGLMKVASDRDDYRAKLEFLLKANNPMDAIVRSSRFYSWNILGNCFDMSDFLSKEGHCLEKLPNKYQQDIVDIIKNKQSIVNYNLTNLLAQDNDLRDEIEANKLGLRRIIDKIFLPNEEISFVQQILNLTRRKKNRKCLRERVFVDYELKYSEDLSKINEFVNQTKRNNNLRYLIKDGIHAILILNGKMVKRTSKLVSNLARIHEEV